MSDLSLKNYREVGLFDLLSPPLTPIGLVDGQLLGAQIKELIESGSLQIVLDCSGLDFLYSDTLTILAQAHQILQHKNGTLGIMSTSESIVNSINKSALADLMTIYPVETDLIQASMRLMSGQKPPVQSGQHQHDHDLEVVEAMNNDGFELMDAHAVQSSESEVIVDYELEKKSDLANGLQRHDQTSAIHLVAEGQGVQEGQEVQEEQFSNPNDLSQKLTQARDVHRTSFRKRPITKIAWSVIILFVVALTLISAWYLKLVEL